jgi:hypothetical protein
VSGDDDWLVGPFRILLPGSAAFEDAVSMWNGAVTQRPAVDWQRRRESYVRWHGGPGSGGGYGPLNGRAGLPLDNVAEVQIVLAGPC